MATFENCVLRQGKDIIRVNVAVDYSHIQVQDPPIVEWGGRLLPPNNTGLMPGHTYTLQIPDFTTSKIRISEEADPNGEVAFKGIGPVPAGKPEHVKG